MRVRHADRKLQRLEAEANYAPGFGRDVVKAFRKVMAVVRAAPDERAFYGLKSLHYEKLKGDRRRQRSMRLTDQFRLVLELHDEEGRIVVVIGIEDYH